MTQAHCYEVHLKKDDKGYQPWEYKYFSSDNSEEYRRKLHNIVRGSADWEVREVSLDFFNRALGLN